MELQAGPDVPRGKLMTEPAGWVTFSRTGTAGTTVERLELRWGQCQGKGPGKCLRLEFHIEIHGSAPVWPKNGDVFSQLIWRRTDSICNLLALVFWLKPSHVLVFCVFVPAEFTGFRIGRFCSKKDAGSPDDPLFCFGSVVTLVEMKLRILRPLQDASVLLAYPWAVAAPGDLDQKVSELLTSFTSSYDILWESYVTFVYICEFNSSQTDP